MRWAGGGRRATWSWKRGVITTIFPRIYALAYYAPPPIFPRIYALAYYAPLPIFPRIYALSRITRHPARALRLCQQGNAQSAGAAVAPVAARER